VLSLHCGVDDAHAVVVCVRQESALRRVCAPPAFLSLIDSVRVVSRGAGHRGDDGDTDGEGDCMAHDTGADVDAARASVAATLLSM
jgi:hypothetical protein